MALAWISVLTVGVLISARYGTGFVYGPPCDPIDEYRVHESDCTKFYLCSPQGLTLMDCPANLYFDISSKRCDYSYRVPNCRNGTIPPRSPCAANPCVNGTCVLQNNTKGYVCNCYPGFTGPDCFNDVDECFPNNGPCDQGPCVNTYGSFYCNCGNNGYTGQYCEIPPPEGPCINGQPCVNGKCQLVTNSNVCGCKPGFGGVLCDSVISGECSSRPCMNGGRCLLQPGGYYCDCTGTNFEGNFCETRNTSCTVNVCTHGRCVADGTGFECICDGSGYDGLFCNNPIQDNRTCGVNSPCLRGTCLSLASGAFCDCAGTGYTGENCQIQVVNGNYCFPGACRNGGVCVSGTNSYTCNCAGTVYGGPRCDMTGCNYEGMSPCWGNSTCVPQPNLNFICNCGPWFTGPTCQTVIRNIDCPSHQCPLDVPSYRYPDLSDLTCRGFYNCQRGSLTNQTCGTGQKFDLVSMICRSATDQFGVFCDVLRSIATGR